MLVITFDNSKWLRKMVNLFNLLMCWSVAYLTFLVAGAGIFRLLSIPNVGARPLYQMAMQTAIGIAVVNTILGFISSIYPVTSYSALGLGVCAVGITSIGSVRQTLKFNFAGLIGLSWHLKLLLIVVAGLILFTTYLPSVNYDSGLYHNQFIMWMNTYPVVPGLANLHERFGFNSHWHLLASAYNGFPFSTQLLNDVGSLLVLVFLMASIESAGKLLDGKTTMFDGLMILFFLPLYLLVRFFTSDTPDLPNTILGFLILSIPFCNELIPKTRLYSIAIVGGLLITIKVSSFLLLAGVIPSLLKIKPKNIGVAFVVGFLILLPWLGRTYVMGGYLVYPASFTAIGVPDFQAPSESLEYVNALLESHGKFGYYDVTLVGRPLSEWAMPWITRQTTAIKIILALCCSLWLVFFLWDLYRAVRTKWSYEPTLHTLIHVAFMLSLSIVFKLAPEIRYAYGSLLFYFVFMLLKVGLVKFRWLTLGVAAVGFVLFVRMVAIVAEEGASPILSKTYAVIEGSARPIYYPIEFDQCWEHELPCTNRYIEGLEMRTGNLKDGFRIVKPE